MNHTPFEPDREDGERLLRSSLQRALLRPAPESIARGVQQRLAALAALAVPSRFLRGLMHYGSVAGLAVLVLAVIIAIVLGQPASAPSASSVALPSFSQMLSVLSTLPTAASATTIGIVVVLLCGVVSTELSRR